MRVENGRSLQNLYKDIEKDNIFFKLEIDGNFRTNSIDRTKPAFVENTGSQNNVKMAKWRVTFNLLGIYASGGGVM